MVLGLFPLVVGAQSVQEREYKKNYESRIQLSRINDVYIPSNTDEAMKELVRLTEPEARAKLLTVPEDSIASKLHFSFGRWMLIHWGFDEGSRISHYYSLKGIRDTDDKLDLLIRCFYRHLENKPLREEELIKYYIGKEEAEAELRKKKAKVLQTLGPSKKHNE